MRRLSFCSASAGSSLPLLRLCYWLCCCLCCVEMATHLKCNEFYTVCCICIEWHNINPKVVEPRRPNGFLIMRHTQREIERLWLSLSNTCAIFFFFIFIFASKLLFNTNLARLASLSLLSLPLSPSSSSFLLSLLSPLFSTLFLHLSSSLFFPLLALPWLLFALHSPDSS